MKRRLSGEDWRLLQETMLEFHRQGRWREEKLAKQHGSTSVYRHSVHVACISLLLARWLRIRLDRKSLVRGALLHDYFLYDWHEKGQGHRLHGFRHAKTAMQNAHRDYVLNRTEKNIISRHMFPLTVLPPQCREGWLVCLADKWCAAAETIKPLFKRRGRRKRRYESKV